MQENDKEERSKIRLEENNEDNSGKKKKKKHTHTHTLTKKKVLSLRSLHMATHMTLFITTTTHTDYLTNNHTQGPNTYITSPFTH